MARARVLRISLPDELRKKEQRINKKLKAKNPQAPDIHLFKTSDGEYGFEVRITLLPGNKRAFDELYDFVMTELGVKRGRKLQEPTTQVKARVPESTYKWLEKRAKASKKSVSRVLAEVAEEFVKDAAKIENR